LRAGARRSRIRGGPSPRLEGKALDVLRGPRAAAAARCCADGAEALPRLVAEANALTLAEYADRLAERTGVRVSVPSCSPTCRLIRFGRASASRIS
jgi:hypothetical protein